MISSTCFGYSDLEVSKFCFKVPARRNGDCASPNKGSMNLKVSTCNESLSLIQWNRSASRSASQICTSKKACLMSPPKAAGLRQFQTSTLQSKLCRGGPVSKESFNEGYSVLLLLKLFCTADNILFSLESNRSLSPQYLLSVGSGLVCQTHLGDWLASAMSS